MQFMAPRLGKVWRNRSCVRLLSTNPLHRHVHMCIDQKNWILNMISPDDYIKMHASPYNGSVGGHMRHSMDHFSRLIATTIKAQTGTGVAYINYDDRERNTTIECDKDAAIKDLHRISADINRLLASDRGVDGGALVARFIGDCSTGETYDLDTNFTRELSFVCHHATHHLFFCKMMMEVMGYDVSGSNIGVANSTILHQADDCQPLEK